jgi:hypothetical protein
MCISCRNLDAVLVQTKAADLETLAACMGYSSELDHANRSPPLAPSAAPVPLPKMAEPVPKSKAKAAVPASAYIGKDVTTSPVSSDLSL